MNAIKERKTDGVLVPLIFKLKIIHINEFPAHYPGLFNPGG